MTSCELPPSFVHARMSLPSAAQFQAMATPFVGTTATACSAARAAGIAAQSSALQASCALLCDALVVREATDLGERGCWYGVPAGSACGVAFDSLLACVVVGRAHIIPGLARCRPEYMATQLQAEALVTAVYLHEWSRCVPVSTAGLAAAAVSS